MADACAQGYKNCVWSRDTGVKLTCMFGEGRCPMIVGPSVAVDTMSGRIAHNTRNTVDAFRTNVVKG